MKDLELSEDEAEAVARLLREAIDADHSSAQPAGAGPASGPGPVEAGAGTAGGFAGAEDLCAAFASKKTAPLIIPADEVFHMDPATTRAVAKAAEETAKTTGKALDIVHDTGGYLRQVFGELIVNAVGWLIGDWVSHKRYRNVDALCRRTSEILHERDVNEAIELSPNQAMELLTGAQDESRPELAELWARVLANAMDPNLNSVRQSFIDAVKRMDPPDARVLHYMAEKKFSAVLLELPGVEAAPNALVNIAADMALRRDDVELSVHHLQSLLFFEPIGNGGWRTTVTLREFARACYPELWR